MAEMSERQKRRLKRDKDSKVFGRSHNYDPAQIKEIMASNQQTPGVWQNDLDRKVMANSNNPKRYRADVLDKLDTTGMRNFAAGDVNRYVNMVAADFDKDKGRNLAARGESSAFGHSLKQANTASFGQKALSLGNHLLPFGASSRDAVLTTMGFSSRDSKILAAKGSMMEKINRRVLAPAFGLSMLYAATDSEDPGTDYATSVAAGAGLIQGWRVGRDLGNFGGVPLVGKAGWNKATHFRRLSRGLAGAALGAAIPTMAIAGQAAMFKNDSFVGKSAKKAYSREMNGSLKETRESLTMRQAGLEKLSSSYLNNRQQLLGNEASILRNAQM